MKIYLVRFHDSDMGEILSWHSSGKAALLDLHEKQRDRKKCGRERQGEESFEAIDVEPSRQGILNLLNAYATRDNG